MKRSRSKITKSVPQSIGSLLDEILLPEKVASLKPSTKLPEVLAKPIENEV